MMTVSMTPADIAGKQSEPDAERRREGDAEEADEERDAQAVEDGRQDVASLFVGAEKEGRLALRLPDRGQAAVHELELGRIEGILRRDKAGDEARATKNRRVTKAATIVSFERLKLAQMSLSRNCASPRTLVAMRRSRRAIERCGHRRHAQAGCRTLERRRGSTTV